MRARRKARLAERAQAKKDLEEAKAESMASREQMAKLELQLSQITEFLQTQKMMSQGASFGQPSVASQAPSMVPSSIPVPQQVTELVGQLPYPRVDDNVDAVNLAEVDAGHAS